MRRDHIAGCLFGTAFGDALGAPTEFIRDVASIRQRFGPEGPAGPPNKVTDDTQMALAVGEALMAAKRPYTVDTLEPALRKEFVAWMISPENTRAPGFTCMRACGRLAEGFLWWDCSILNSKGCGANMRVQPVGCLTTVDATTRAGIAQFQAALTHGHPTGLAASDLTAYTITYLLEGGKPTQLLETLLAYAESQRTVYHEAWLGPIWQQSGISSREEFIARGWEESLEVLNRARHVMDNIGLIESARAGDPCKYTGEGWIAEEAFATGLLCFLLYPNDPVAAVRRAAVTSGDSDSIACLTGAFAGAYHGLCAWPTPWLETIEYRARLENLVQFLSEN